MKLSEADARRVLTFCLPREYHVEIARGDELCTLRVVPLEEGAEQRLFEAPSFEEALRAAAAAGLARPECIERQIAFVTTYAGRPPLVVIKPPPPAQDEPAHAAATPAAPPPPKLTLQHYRALAEFRYRIRKFVTFSESAARHEGLEPQQHQLLLAIRGLPPPKRANVATLAERMCLDVGACEALAGGLLARGLTRWTPNPADRREQLLALTPAGRKILRRLTELHREQMLAVGPTFVQVLGAILSSFEEAEGGGAEEL